MMGIIGGENTSGVTYQAESLTIFAAFTTPPTTARKNAIDAVVVALKNASIWTKLDALYVMAAADSQAAKINWKSPGTYDLTAVNSPTFTTDVGFSNEIGSTAYLDTAFNPSTATSPNFVRDSATFFGWALDANQAAGAAAGTVLGHQTSPFVSLTNRYNDGKAYFYVNDAAGTAITNADGAGLLSASRTGGSAGSCYRNGSSIGSISTASGAVANAAIRIINDASSNELAGGCSIVGFGSQMDATAHSALYTALNTYMQAVCQTTYTGPQDIVASATAWYGLRSVDRAHIGANCVTIIRASDSATQTFLTTPGGGVDVAGITTFLTSTTGKVTKIWDQTGKGNHLSQGTDANRPALTLSGLGSLPVMTFTRASSTVLKLTTSAFNGGSTISQAYTISCVGKDTGLTSGQYGQIFGGDASPTFTGVFFENNGGTADVNLFINADHRVNKTANTYYAVQGVFNGASSDLNIDGSANSISGGATAFQVANVEMGSNSGGDFLLGVVTEAGIWPVAFTGTNSTNMSSNQHSYWGF